MKKVFQRETSAPVVFQKLWEKSEVKQIPTFNLAPIQGVAYRVWLTCWQPMNVRVNTALAGRAICFIWLTKKAAITVDMTSPAALSS